MELWRLKVEPWRACRPIVEDLHHFDDEKDLDLHQSEKSDPDSIKVNGELDPGSAPCVLDMGASKNGTGTIHKTCRSWQLHYALKKLKL
jgi:hypothetical protein